MCAHANTIKNYKVVSRSLFRLLRQVRSFFHFSFINTFDDARFFDYHHSILIPKKIILLKM